MTFVVKDLVVRYHARGLLPSRRPDTPAAVDGVQLSIEHGTIVALVGESGSGKSTLARCLVHMQRITSGTVSLDGIDLTSLRRRELKEFRRRVQMIFQDPYESLSPRQRVRDIVGEGLVIHGVPRNERDGQVRAALESVGLNPPESFMDRWPFELSGGQRQRVAIASSLALEPNYIIADEPVSMLDVSVRAGVLNLLDKLRTERNLGVLMITHDLATAVHIADRIVVLQHGKVVEEGPARQVVENPSHPYTKALLAATPHLDRGHVPAELETDQILSSATNAEGD